MSRIYIQRWETNRGLRLEVAFTEYEMKKMPYEYRFVKTRNLAEKHGFDIKDASIIEEFFFENNELKTGSDE